MTTANPLYRRILLKVSGEALMGGAAFGIDMATLDGLAEDIAATQAAGFELCLVVGGGNIFRGVSMAGRGMERASADYMGMLATVMNALAVQSALEKLHVDTRVQSAIPMDAICEPYIRRRALRHLEKGRIVIFAAGLGAPFFTTDTPAALRAAEMGCDALFKGTSVDGVYSADPKKDRNAKRLDKVTYQEVLAQDLRFMDASAISLMRDNGIPIVIFSIRERGNLLKVLRGEALHTTIQHENGAG